MYGLKGLLNAIKIVSPNVNIQSCIIHQIPLFKDENTAHVLCSLPVGEEIPVELYQAVAEIYAFILKVSFENYSKGKISENK